MTRTVVIVAIVAALFVVGSTSRAEEPYKKISETRTTIGGFPATITLSTPGGRPLIDRSHTKIAFKRGRLADPTRRYHATTVGDTWVVTTPQRITNRLRRQFQVDDGVLTVSAKMARPRLSLRSFAHQARRGLSRLGRAVGAKASSLARWAMGSRRLSTTPTRRGVSLRPVRR